MTTRQRTTLALSDTFSDGFRQLPPGPRRECQRIMMLLCRHPDTEELEFSPVIGAASYIRSLPLPDGHAAVFCRPEDGGYCLALCVGPREKAFEWAVRHIVRVNPVTGVMQVYESMETPMRQGVAAQDAVEALAREMPEEQAADGAPETGASVASGTSGTRLLASIAAADLLKVGVPEECLPAVEALSDRAGLEALRPKLPAEAFEALVWLADGEPLEAVLSAYEPRPTADPGDALRNPTSQRSFRVIESDEAMKEIMNASLERWRIFLHPLQRRLVERREASPALVRGAAGTGKTVVAMHRAVHLALLPDWKPEDRILFTTFTKNLAADIRAQLDLLFDQCGHWDERNRVEVTNLDAWVAAFLRSNGIRERIAYPGNGPYEACWSMAMTSADAGIDLPEGFYAEEWNRVILPGEVMSEAEYLRAPRRGRGTSLSRRERRAVWPVFAEMRTQLRDAGLVTIEEACQLAAHVLENRRGVTEYRAVIVDETQDFGDDALKLLARLALPEGDPAQEPRIFLVGDGRQRIYARTGTLSSCGINVRGRRSERLRITYRTTEEIRQAAGMILAGESFNDMDEGCESDRGDQSNRHGEAPVVFETPDFNAECDWLAERIREVRASLGIGPRDICIVARTKEVLERYAKRLEALGLPGLRLSRGGTDDPDRPGLRFATMHRVKGLEFRAVFIVNAGARPNFTAAESEDPVERHRTALTERSLLYVAATRARDVLFVSGPSVPWFSKP